PPGRAMRASVHQRETEMNALRAPVPSRVAVQHVRVVEPTACISAPREAQPHSCAGNELARVLVRQGLVPPYASGIEERQCPQPCLVPLERRPDVGTVHFCRDAVAPVVYALTLVEATHAVGAADSELLAWNEGVVRILAVQHAAQLPVAGKQPRPSGLIAVQT